MNNELLWYVSRATGLVSIVLLTVVVVLGLVTSAPAAPAGTRRPSSWDCTARCRSA